MKIYNYDPVSKVYTGETEADESPLEPGVFLVPAHATPNPPPAVPDGHFAVWEDAWIIKRDTSEDITAEMQKQKQNAEARALLAKTDWYIIRSIETGVQAPKEILDLRAAARESVVE